MISPENRFWAEEFIRSVVTARLPRRFLKRSLEVFNLALRDVSNPDFLESIDNAVSASQNGELLKFLFIYGLGEETTFSYRAPWKLVDDTRFDGFIAELITRPDLVEKIFARVYPRELHAMMLRHDINPIPDGKRLSVHLGKPEFFDDIGAEETEDDVLGQVTVFLAVWICTHTDSFLHVAVGDITKALNDYGLSPQRPITALPRSLERVLRDEAQLIDIGLPPTKRRAYGELLFFGLQPFASLGTTVGSILPAYVAQSYRHGNMLYRENCPFAGRYEELLGVAQRQIRKLLPALEAGESDFEPSGRRPLTLWEEMLQERGLAGRTFEHLSVKESPNESPFDLVFEATLAPAPFKPNEKETAADMPLELSAEQFLVPLMTMPRWAVVDAPENFVVWRAVVRMAAKLLAAGSLVPTPVWHEDTLEVNYLWLPAMYLPQVRERVSRLAALLSPYSKELFAKSLQMQGKHVEQLTALRALALAVSAILRMSVKSKKSLANHEIVERLTASSFGKTNPELNDNYFFHIQRNRFDSRCVYSDLRTLLLRTALPEELVISVRNAGGGKAAATIGFTPKKTQIADGRLIRVDQVLSVQKAYPALARAAAYTVETYSSTFNIFSRFKQKLDKYIRQAAKKTPKNAASPHEALEVELSTSEIEDFLFNEAPKCAVAGIYVRLPEELKNLLEPKLIAVAEAGETLETKGLLDKYSLADFRWEAAVGNARISLDELRGLIKKAGHIVSYKDRFVYLTQEASEKIQGQLAANKRVTNWDKLRAVLTGNYQGAAVEASDSVRERLNALLAVDELQPPAELAATLRPYQLRGFSWLMKNLRLGLGALIADDMGLGKTVQVIAALQQFKNDGELSEGSVLVVVPASVITNWMRELARFAPSLSVTAHHGQNRKLPQTMPDVVITSYRILANDLEILSKRKWRLLVLDEAQAIKNSATEQSTAARYFPAPQVIAMSGTPVENRLQEFWSIMAAVQPKLLGSLRSFRDTFARPIEEERSELVLEQFRRLTKPFMIRRMKSDKNIIADLPARESIDYFTTLTVAQTALYEECLKTSLADLDQLSEQTRQIEDSAQNAEGSEGENQTLAALNLKRRGNILRMITHLKQIVNSPSHFQKSSCDKPDSGKGQALIELLGQCFEAERKVLVFTQFAEMGHLLVGWIAQAFGRKPDFLHGGVPIAERQAMIDRFQNDIRSKVLVLSLKAGGLGLNLTSASAVIHYDLWWNPAVEAQANDRAYRIGQNRDVIVYRFITEGTFEEKLNKMIERKKELADVTITTGEAWIGDLSNREIEEIFKISR